MRQKAIKDTSTGSVETLTSEKGKFSFVMVHNMFRRYVPKYNKHCFINILVCIYILHHILFIALYDVDVETE